MAQALVQFHVSAVSFVSSSSSISFLVLLLDDGITLIVVEWLSASSASSTSSVATPILSGQIRPTFAIGKTFVGELLAVLFWLVNFVHFRSENLFVNRNSGSEILEK